MTKITSYLSALALIPLLVSCASLGQLDGNAKAPTENESIFVMGISPDNYRVSLFPGSVEDGQFHQNPVRSAALYASARDGYVVGKATAGDVLGLANVKIVSDSGALLGPNYRACGDAKTMVFTVPKGKVIYLGDMGFFYKSANLPRESSLSIRYYQDLAAAQTYVDKNFPALKGRLESFEVEWKTHLRTCAAAGGAIYIPIYINRK